jgi:hypothetical protein
MERTSDEQDPVRVVRPSAHASGIVRLDREALEGAMREDVFRAADGRALAADLSSVWLPSRRNGRRT